MEMLNNISKNQDISFAELTESLKLKKMNNSFIFQPNISNQNDRNQDKSIFNLYDSIMIKQILDSYIEVMKNINNLENNDIRNIEYMSLKERERIIKEFNSDVNKEGCDKLYHEEFKKMAKQYPERIAIVFNEDKISYKELDEMSNSIAHYLRSEGVCRNDIIPIICDRSPYYIIGIL
eukprot:jgi/Orpsp1_1/1181368/evm.model.c7180000076979.1